MRKQLLMALLTTWPCIAGHCEGKNKEQINTLNHFMYTYLLPATHGALCAEKRMLEMQGKSNYNSSLSTLWQQNANESRMIENAIALSKIEEVLHSPYYEKNRSFKYILIQAISWTVVESIGRLLANIGPGAYQKKS